jgi:hypothetical protein
VSAFAEAHVVPDLENGILGIAQANGFAGLQSNTVLFGWAETDEGLARQLRLVRLMNKLRMSTILASLPDQAGPRERRSIDVWWGGLENNGDLMVLLAHLLSLNPEWRRARVSVRSIVSSEEERADMQQKLDELLTEARIEAQADVFLKPEHADFMEVLHAASVEADVVFLGLKVPAPGEELAYARRLQKLAAGFSTAVFVKNAEPFAGELLGES